jgi:predicted permease
MPGFFAAIGTPLLVGRDFTAGDSAGAPRVAVVNEAFGRRYWPGASAIGRQFGMDDAGGPLVTVVGVARDAKYRDLAEPLQPFLYLPITQSYEGSATIVVRADAGDPLALVPQVRRAVAALDPQLPVSDVRTMDALLKGRALLLPRFAATLAGAFGLLALALAIVGLAGVVAYTVGLRTREIGIRLALGATPGTVVGESLRDGASLAGIGIAAGLVLAVAFARLLRSLLYRVGPADPLTFGAIALALAVTAALASWLPARRAARVDPVEALRSE